MTGDEGRRRPRQRTVLVDGALVREVLQVDNAEAPQDLQVGVHFVRRHGAYWQDPYLQSQGLQQAGCVEIHGQGGGRSGAVIPP